MLQQNFDNLDALILEEKKRVALEFFSEAWSNSIQEGIEPEILAESALVTALTNLANAEGSDKVGTIIANLEERLQCGHFDPDRTLQ